MLCSLSDDDGGGGGDDTPAAAAADDDDDDDSTAGHAPNKLSKSEAEKRFMVTLSAKIRQKNTCPNFTLP